MTSEQTKLAVISEQIKNIVKEAETFVTQTEFKPVKAIVFGLVGGILLAALSVITKFLFK
jgi:hypothetical protein